MRDLAPTPNRRVGIACSVGGIASVTLSDTIIRLLLPIYPPHEILFLRGLLIVPLLATVMLLSRNVDVRGIRDPGLLVVRALLMASTAGFLTLSLGILPYAEAIAIFFTSPLLTILISVFLYGERAGFRLWFAAFVGMGGVVVMLRPLGAEIDARVLLPLGAAVSYSCMQVFNRQTRRVHSGIQMTLSAHAGILVASALAGAVLWDGRFATTDNPVLELLLRGWTLPDLEAVMLLAGAGLLSTLGTFLLFQSYRLAQASLIATFEYVALPLATLSGFLFWSEVPDLTALAGIALIVGAGLYVIAGERARPHPVRSRSLG